MRDVERVAVYPCCQHCATDAELDSGAGCDGVRRDSDIPGHRDVCLEPYCSGGAGRIIEVPCG